MILQESFHFLVRQGCFRVSIISFQYVPQQYDFTRIFSLPGKARVFYGINNIVPVCFAGIGFTRILSLPGKIRVFYGINNIVPVCFAGIGYYKNLICSF